MWRDSMVAPCLVTVLGFVSCVFGIDVNFTFSCPGHESAAEVEDGYNVVNICGDSPELSFIANEDLNMAEIQVSFSEDTRSVDADHVLMTFPIVGYKKDTEWLPSDVSMVVNNKNLPCGGGYIVAELRKNGMRVAAEYQKAMRLCDNSDIDLSLHIDSTPKMAGMHPQLYTGRDHGDLLSQLLTYMDITKAVLRNDGSRALASATLETPHMVAVYLQSQHHARNGQTGEGCNVPRYRIIDQLIGKVNITGALGAGQELNLVPHLPGHYIPQVSSVCGEAELVIFYDPLMIDDDANICNNFLTMPVHVMCSGNKLNHSDCMVCSNPVDVNTWAMFGNTTFYEYDDMEGKWESRDLRTIDAETEMELIHAGMSQMMHQHLSNLYTDPGEGICMFALKYRAEEMSRIERMPMDDVKIGDELEQKIQEVMMRMKTSMIMDNLIQPIQMMADEENDPVNKSLISGSVMGLSMAQGVHMVVMKSQVTGERFPSNTTRLMLGQMLKGLAQIHHMAMTHPMMASMYGLQVLSYAQALRIVTHALKEYRLLPEKVIHMLMRISGNMMNRIMHSMSNGTGSNSWEMPSIMCPFGQQIDMVSKALLTLSNGWDGMAESNRPAMPESTMATAMCHANILRVFMHKGGYKLIRKAHLKRFLMESGMKQDDLMKIPKECRRHPFQPFDVPLENMFVNDDGKIVRGAHSPLENTMTYKVVATCRCQDTCSKDTTSGSDMGGSTGMWRTTPFTSTDEMWNGFPRTTPSNVWGR